MQNNDNNLNYIKEISIFDLFSRFASGLKRFWALILALIGVGGCLGFGYSFMSYTPYYTARSTFTITANVALSESFYSSATASQLSKTFPNVLTSSLLLNIVSEDLGEPLSERIHVNFIEDTNLFSIEVYAPTSQQAYDVLTSMINNYHSVTKYVIGNSHFNSITEPSVTSEPTNSIEYKQYTLIGAGIGLALGLLILSLYAFSYNYINHPEDIDQIGLPLIGALIKENRFSDVRIHTNPHVRQSTSHQFQESVYYLRNAVLREIRVNKLRSFIVTAPCEGDGASTVAVNLAFALNSRNLRVILIDGDLRRPSVARLCGLDNPAHTLNEVLEGEVEWNDAVSHISSENLDVICAEKTKQASELISSERMRELIEQLEYEYDIVIIDTPPCTAVSDARSLAIPSDAMLYVIGREVSRLQQIEYGLDGFKASGIHLIGCVMNMATSGTLPNSIGDSEIKKLQSTVG